MNEDVPEPWDPLAYFSCAYLIALLDDLCHSYLDFCDDHLVGGYHPI